MKQSTAFIDPQPATLILYIYILYGSCDSQNGVVETSALYESRYAVVRELASAVMMAGEKENIARVPVGELVLQKKDDEWKNVNVVTDGPRTTLRQGGAT